jgi:hypothetical protein
MAHAMMLFVLGLLPGTVESLSLAAAEWAPPRRDEALAAHKPLGDFVRVLDRDDAGAAASVTPAASRTAASPNSCATRLSRLVCRPRVSAWCRRPRTPIV